MKHQLFFYLTFSYSIGFFSLAILILAYLKSWWKALLSIMYFLLAGTIQLIFLTYVEYQNANIPIWFNTWYAVINYSLESLNIFLFPMLVTELFNATHRRLITYISGFLFLGGLACIVIPFLLGAINNGTQLESLSGYKIYRLIFIGAYIYSFLFSGLKIKTVNDPQERNFYLYSLIILLVLAFQTVVPIFKTFPENLFIFATGYFGGNVLLLKYLVNRFFQFSRPPVKENLDQVVTSREKEVLFLLVEGLSNKDIGIKLCITETTVKSHVQNIYKKLGVSNRVQLLNSLKNYLDLNEMK